MRASPTLIEFGFKHYLKYDIDMIRTLSGTVISLEPGGVVIDVSGWGLFVNLATIDSIIMGDKITIYTHLAIKKNGPELYGFTSQSDRAFFELALTVPGFGTKTALSLLKRAELPQIEKAISARDIKYLTRVVGLGKKAAEKIVIELADKVATHENIHGDTDTEVFDMLIALGYNGHEARQALGAIPKEVSGRDARLKSALSASTH